MDSKDRMQRGNSRLAHPVHPVRIRTEEGRHAIAVRPHHRTRV